MAEQEISKHTKKAYKIWNSRNHTWKHKLKEFLIEIAIIVFAVTISIWFHNLSEKSHDKKEVRNFLAGLKTDMEKDMDEMKNDTMSYGTQMRFFNYLASLKPGEMPDSARLRSDDWTFHNSTILVPNISRFETLKYSGLMGKVENKELLDEILNLYEELLPQLVKDAGNSVNLKFASISAMLDSVYYNGEKDKQSLNDLIKTNKRFVFELGSNAKIMQRVYDSYKDVLSQYKKVIGMIDKELK